MQQTDKKILFSIRGLKQYFPVKGKRKLFVKACDGITLDIYEGETLGLVGESGCGKTTLGRVLLQLYHQTFGKTMYYGRNIEDIAPDYVRKTISRLPSGIRKMNELEKKRLQVENELNELQKSKDTFSDDAAYQKRFFEKTEELQEASRIAEDSYLNIVQLIGGFVVSDDLGPVIDASMNIHKVASDKCRVREKMNSFKMELQAKEYKYSKSGKKIDENSSKKKKFLKLEEEYNKLGDELAKLQEQLDLLRDKYRSYPDFEKHEAFRDSGIDLARLKYEEMRILRRDIQLIFQDPYSSLNPRMTVGQIIGEGLQTHKFFKEGSDLQQEYTIEVMEKCGLAPYMLHRYPHQFSGGQRQRIGIARSLAVKPKFVVCDEAVSALDVSIQSQVLNLLQDLRDEEHLTYMFISHDLSVIKYISDRVGVMYLGNIVELAPASVLYENPIHPYTIALLSAIPTTDYDEASREMVILEGDIPSPINPPKGCKFHTRCTKASDVCKQVTPLLEEISADHFVACHNKGKQGDGSLAFRSG